jgi:translation initiation factor eIF-2B subunit epsilon
VTLQAVILADAFDSKLTCFTLDYSHVRYLSFS